MSKFVLSGYSRCIYSVKGVDELLNKIWEMPVSKLDVAAYTESWRVYNKAKSIIEDYKKTVEPTIKKLAALLKNENERFSDQVAYITMKRLGKKFSSNFEDLMVIGGVADVTIYDLCSIEVKNDTVKKFYKDIIDPIEKFNKKYPGIKEGQDLYDSYFATDEIKNMVDHGLRRKGPTDGSEWDSNTGKTEFKGKEVLLPKGLTNNHILIMEKNGRHYYVKDGNTVLCYNKNGKKLRTLPHHSFGEKSILEIEKIFNEIWGS